MSKYIRYLVVLAGSLAMVGCSVTRYVPEGEYLLNRNIIETDRSVPRKERITEEELDRFVRQTPSRKLLRTNIPVAIWSMSDTSKNNLLSRIVRRMGSAPVILDSSMIYRSAANIENYMRSRGYYESELRWGVKTKGRKATVTYGVTQGQPYRIGAVRYNFRDQFLRPVISADTVNTLVKRGDIFDIEILNSERARISDYLRDNGYYNFTVNNVSYLADSTVGNKMVNLTLNVRPYLASYNADGQPEFENHAIYRLGTIYINPDYDPVAAVSDPLYYQKLDTTEYMGLNILYQGKPKVRKKILRRAVRLYPNALYSASEVQDAYSGLMRLGFFRSASILFRDLTDSVKMGETTYIGTDERQIFTETTNEGYLQCNINCIPALRQSYKIDFEGSVASNFYAVGVTLGYQNRNLFRGAELFDASLTGRYEFFRRTSNTGSYEIGGSASLSFPNFVTSFDVDRKGRVSNPGTRVEVSLQYQHRPLYRRTLSGVRLSYTWNNNKYGSFVLRPVDVNVVNVSDLDSLFASSLKNKYLLNSYKTQLVPGISFSYVYNNQLRNPGSDHNSIVFRLNAETMGNLFSLLSRAFSNPVRDPEMDADYYQILGIRFSQYARLEASISHRIVTGNKTSMVWRILAGGGVSYGNNTSITIDRLFYSGGSNSMRGWIARKLGPGTSPSPKDDYPSQVGNLKLEANLEFRFPVWDFFHGAVFLDAGNVWFAGNRDFVDGETDRDAVFNFSRFYKQLGLNTGLGLRLDFSRFIFRVDWGIKLHDPGEPAGDRWIKNFRIKNTVLNFGVGYPF